MLLFFWLIALLSSTGLAEGSKKTVYKVPKGTIPDGTLTTFYFLHTGNEGKEGMESVWIKFFTSYSSPAYAHIRIDRKPNTPVATNTKSASGVFGDDTTYDQILEPEMPPSNGWWRVDVHKFDEFQANICFQGFWSDVRTFKISLTNIEYIEIESDFVDHSNMLIVMNLHNDNLPLFGFAQWTNMYEQNSPTIPYVFPKFPVGAHIEMTVWFPHPAFEGFSKRQPGFEFLSKIEAKHIFAIRHYWTFGTGWNSFDIYTSERKTCIEVNKIGNLQHFYLERIAPNILRLRALYRDGIAGVPCEVTLKEQEITHLDSPIEMTWLDGAFPLIMTHSIPMENDAKLS